MLIVAIVDALAESRVRVATQLSRTLAQPGADFHLLPRINVVPLAVQELKFHSKPHVVIVGPGLVDQEITTISSIRTQLPDAKILALVPSNRNRIGSLEHLVRLGADDVVDEACNGTELLTRLVLLARRVDRNASAGKLVVVDGVKGGVGATSVVAALAETIALRDESVVVVDCDAANRGLSRFLRARPLINENLQLILDGLRSSTPEFVAQTRATVVAGMVEIGCVPPPGSDERWGDADGVWIRNFLSVIEVLDESAGYVVVDLSRLAGKVREALIRAADSVIFVASQDPACLPATVERVKIASALVGADVPLCVLRNERDRDGIVEAVWHRELKRVADVANLKVLRQSIRYTAAGGRWAVSGSTFASLGGAAVRGALTELANTVCGEQHSDRQLTLIETLKTGCRNLIAKFAKEKRESDACSDQRVAALLPVAPQSTVSGAKPREIEFFVSAPRFSSSASNTPGEKSSPERIADDEVLVTPAKLSAA